MKLKFDSELDYQKLAIEAVTDLFRGQEINRTEFTVTYRSVPQSVPVPGMDESPTQLDIGLAESSLGIGNRLTLLDEDIHNSLKEIQLRNGLPPSGSLVSGDFTVEMETGTGKTYVFTRTIFELNKRYGFTKFVVVVPSIAIKEGIYKSLQLTEDHFRGLYAGVPVEYFLYDSSKLGPVRNFAISAHIQIMIVTVGAINKEDVNNLYKESEQTGGEQPIDLIRSTRPVLIVDEPQSVDGGLGGAGKKALGAMNALCTLRYSATHVDNHHMVYRLDAIDAYEQKLVKQIEVASATVDSAHNRPYVRFISAANRNGTITAKVEVEAETSNGVRPQQVTVQDGDDLEQTTGRTLYADHRIGEIRTATGAQHLELRTPGDEVFLEPGGAYGAVDPEALHRQMIRRTIREHLEKEKRLVPQGIKVLSLFFIDEVAKYRQYDEDGNQQKGPYAHMFEDEYRRASRHPDFRELFDGVDIDAALERVHNGYFSVDKTGGWTDTSESNAPGRDAAERAYSLIMQDKEALLSFDTPLKFIFSHSALREGWDNPNVFQICALRDIRTELERRQTIGRGLRICVNQDGERVHGFDVNTLTVIATESYEEFAENLQKEIEEETGIRFGVVESHEFASISPEQPDGSLQALGVNRSQELWSLLRETGHLDSKGQIQDTLREALRDESLELPAAFEPYRAGIIELLKKHIGRSTIKNADERRTVKPREAVLDSEDFKALWDRIKFKTTYRVEFDNEKLIQDCVAGVQGAATGIPRTRLVWRTADLAIGQEGVTAEERSTDAPVFLDTGDIELPDVLTELQDRTHLTRRSLYSILTESGSLEEFKRNPQEYIERTTSAINHRKHRALVDGIRYQRLGDDEYYAQELFRTEELTGYLKNMYTETHKSVYEQVVYDSGIEEAFADQLEKNTGVKVYAKLPGWFTIPTPLGSYNPDWAVLINTDEGERLYFVVETKGRRFEDLPVSEKEKVRCGIGHFEALASEDGLLDFRVARQLDDLFV